MNIAYTNDDLLREIDKLRDKLNFHRAGRASLASAMHEIKTKLAEAAGKQDLQRIWQLIGAMESALTMELQREEP